MIDFEWRIKRSAARKTLSLIVYSDNRVIAAAPEKLSQEEITAFVEKKSEWVRKRLALNREKQKELPGRQFASGEKLLYLGSEHTLEVCEGRSIGVSLEPAKIVVHIRPDIPAGRRGSLVRRQLMTWYGNMALKKISARVLHYMGIIGVKPRAVRIKSLRSRWGSCSTRGGINFAWNIIMAGEPIVDYLVVHELCHLIHHDHSAEYWGLVASFIPDYRERRRWLKEHGQSLTL